MYVLRGSRITSLSGLLAVALASAQTGQVLHNGITLPAVWPPVRPLAITSQVPPYLISPPPVIPINIGRQLLVDDFLVESTTLTRNNHQATLHPVPILLPGPYENGIWSAPFSDGVWYDPADGLYKLFYKGGVTGLAIGIAYSTDGLTWVRPSIPDSPTPNSNLVIKTNGRDSGTVWLDMLDANPARRFKAFLYQGGGNQRSYFSPDGIHFTLQTAPIYSIYDRTTFFWNAFRQLWVKSARSTEIVTGNAQRPTGDQRVRYYSESPDLVTWTPAARSEAFWVASDDLDPVYPNTTTYPELYNLDAVSYESLTVGMFSMFYPAPGPDLVELNVGFSRDGFYWSRPARGGGPANAFIPASGVAGSWNGFNTQSAGGAFLVVGDELWFYFSARNAPHSVTPTQISTGVAKLRRDGFVSLDAGPVEGTLTTRPITFTGNQLYVNVDAPAGSLQVEILDTAGNVIAPFSKANSLVVQANQTKRQVTWSGVSSLAAIIGQPVKFRFYLQNGKLYSFWVTSSPQGASNGPIAAGGPGFTGPVDKDPQTDFTAPFRLSGAPSGTLTNPVPPNVTLSLITDEPAACRYSPTPGQNYAAMPAAFSAQPGLTSHSAQITVTQSSTPATLSYYVRCQDTVGNANTNDYPIAFVVPSTAPTQGVATLTISPSQVYGGLPVSGSAVTLIAAAPAGGATVSLSSSNPVVASVPAVVDLLAGATISPSFLIATAAVSVTTPVQITATYAGVSITSTLTVVPYPELNTFTVSQASVTGGVSIQGNLSLTGAAAGLSDVNLVSGNPAVLAVPPVVQIADGATSALPFTITTTPVTSTVNVIITATRRSVTKTVSVTVAPVPALAALVAAPADLYLNAAPSTGTVTLNTPAPPGGLSVSLTSDTPQAASVPATITVPVNATTATFPIVAGAAVADTAVTITATYLTVTLTSPITVRVPRAVQTLTLGSLSIMGGTTVTGSQVSINQSALAGNVDVQLSSNNPAKVTVPSTITIPVGATSAPFSFTTNAVAVDTVVILTATYGGVSQTANLTLIAAPVLTAINLGQTAAIGPATVSGSGVTLSLAAPAGGALVQLTSGNISAVTLPASVSVPAGATSASFPISVLATAADTTVTVMASYGGVSKSLDFIAQAPTALTTLTLSQNSITGGGTLSAGSTVTLTRAAGPGDVTVLLQSSDPAATVPASVLIPAGATSATFGVTTLAVTVDTPVVITASLGAITRIANLSVNAPAALTTLTLSENSINGGAPLVAGSAVTLTRAAGPGGTTVLLQSSDPAATVPASVLVPAGATSATFGVTTIAVTVDTPVVITATLGGVTRTANLSVNAPPAALTTLSLSQSSITGGAALAAGSTVTLTRAAGPGGTTVLLQSSDPAAIVPASVLVPAGATSAIFGVTTLAVTVDTPVVITATLGGVSRTANLSVKAPAALTTLTLGQTSVTGGGTVAGSSLTLTVAAPAGGAVILLTSSNPAAATVPASVTVPAGSQSVTFVIQTLAVTLTTPVTINASYGGVSRQASLDVLPALRPATVTLSQPSVSGGQTLSGNLVTLNLPAPAGGTQLQLLSSNPAVIVPASVTVAAGATTATFQIQTTAITTQVTAVITASLGTNGATASLIVTPPPTLLSLALPGTAIGQGSVMQGNVVTLSAPAPPGGMVVALNSNRPTQLQVPATINVPAGASSAIFNITAVAGTLDTIGTITASLNGVTRSATLNLVSNIVYDLKLGAVSISAGAALGGNRVSLNLPAVYGGVLVNLSTSNPAVTLPATILIPAGASFADFSLSTQLVTNGFVTQVTATAGGRSRVASLTVTAAALSSIAAGATSATGGNPVTGNLLKLTLAAPTGGVGILLTSSDPAALTLPSSVLVPAGQTQIAFPIGTNLIPVNKIVTITATYAGVTRTVQVTVNACTLRTLTLSPSTRRGPAVTTANTLLLNLAAPAGGAAVTIVSSNPARATVPATVVVPAGATQVTFPITVGAVTTSTVVTIQAAFGGVTQTANLTVTP